MKGSMITITRLISHRVTHAWHGNVFHCRILLKNL